MWRPVRLNVAILWAAGFLAAAASPTSAAVRRTLVFGGAHRAVQAHRADSGLARLSIIRRVAHTLFGIRVALAMHAAARRSGAKSIATGVAVNPVGFAIAPTFQ